MAMAAGADRMGSFVGTVSQWTLRNGAPSAVLSCVGMFKPMQMEIGETI